MHPPSPACTVARSRAERANAMIRELHQRANAELRDLTDDERVEYRRLRAVWVEAEKAA